MRFLTECHINERLRIASIHVRVGFKPKSLTLILYVLYKDGTPFFDIYTRYRYDDSRFKDTASHFDLL